MGTSSMATSRLTQAGHLEDILDLKLYMRGNQEEKEESKGGDVVADGINRHYCLDSSS